MENTKVEEHKMMKMVHIWGGGRENKMLKDECEYFWKWCTFEEVAEKTKCWKMNVNIFTTKFGCIISPSFWGGKNPLSYYNSITILNTISLPCTKWDAWNKFLIYRWKADLLKDIRDICKFTLSLGLLSPPNPSFNVIRKVWKFYKISVQIAESQHLMHKVREELW